VVMAADMGRAWVCGVGLCCNDAGQDARTYRGSARAARMPTSRRAHRALRGRIQRRPAPTDNFAMERAPSLQRRSFRGSARAARMATSRCTIGPSQDAA
jgi:hypothetical protein